MANKVRRANHPPHLGTTERSTIRRMTEQQRDEAIRLLIMALSMPNMWRGLVQDAIDLLNAEDEDA
jgi:hypothetical protein